MMIISYLSFTVLGIGLVMLVILALRSDRIVGLLRFSRSSLTSFAFALLGSGLLLLGVSFYLEAWNYFTIATPVLGIIGAQIFLWSIGVRSELLNNIPAVEDLRRARSEPSLAIGGGLSYEGADVRADPGERALTTLGYFIALGLFVAAIFPLQSAGPGQFASALSVVLLVAGVSVTCGGMLGFLFGIPRAFPAERTDQREKDSTTKSGSSVQTGANYRPNTNLEEVSDWLTKILIGVGLTQLTAILASLQRVSETVAANLPGGNVVFAEVLILFFLVVGFLFGYLWTRLFLPGAFQKVDLDALRAQVEANRTGIIEAVDKASEAKLIARDSQRISLAPPARSEKIEKSKIQKRETREEEPEETPRTKPVKTDPGDTRKGQFGGRSTVGHRRLTAEVSPRPVSQDYYAVRLVVRSTDQEQHPLTGTVQFYLHPTFVLDKPVVTVNPHGVAELNLTAWGAFTVGAVADDGRTRLELDLAELESAPTEFRVR